MLEKFLTDAEEPRDNGDLEIWFNRINIMNEACKQGRGFKEDINDITFKQNQEETI